MRTPWEREMESLIYQEERETSVLKKKGKWGNGEVGKRDRGEWIRGNGNE